MKQFFVLALSGSLRTSSTNTALLQAAQILAPPAMTIEVWRGQDALPHFSPDMEEAPPDSVQTFRDLVGRADGLLIACPEYARGLPGSFKNALDWLVGGETFISKPFVQWNGSPRALEAQKSLRLVLETMSGIHVDEAAIALPLIKREVTAESIAAHAEWGPQIKTALEVFATTLRKPAA